MGKLERRLHSGTSKYSSTQAQGKQARDRRAEAVCSRCSSSGGCRQLSRWSLVCVRGRKKKWPADMLAQNRCKVLGHPPEKPRSKAAWFQSRPSLMHQKLARHTVQQTLKQHVQQSHHVQVYGRCVVTEQCAVHVILIVRPAKIPAEQ